MRPVPYHKPQSLKDAFRLKKEIRGSWFIAGGTDLLVRMKGREVHPTALISLRSVRELSGIKVGKTSVRIGANTTIADIIANPDLNRACPLLIQAARRLGSAQIRNVATIGGNLSNASPCADTATPLLVMEAEVELRSPQSKRKMELQKFFKDAKVTALRKNEILTAVLIRPPGANVRAKFLKKGRVQLDLAVASVSVLLELKGDGETCTRARVAAGSVAPVPLRLNRVEKLLEGSTLTPALAAEAQQLAHETVTPITDVRSTEEYRRQIVGVYLKRAVHELMGWAQS